jgi:hypothetical protein
MEISSPLILPPMVLSRVPCQIPFRINAVSLPEDEIDCSDYGEKSEEGGDFETAVG